VRETWAHGRDLRIKTGEVLCVIKDIWGRVESGKFKRDIREVTGIPYTTALDYMREAAQDASTNSVPVEDEDGDDDDSEFETGDEQYDPHAERLERLKAEEREKVKRARAASQGRSSITLSVTKVPVAEREKFVAWKKDHKAQVERVLRQVVNCILDTKIGVALVMTALKELIDTAADDVPATAAALSEESASAVSWPRWSSQRMNEFGEVLRWSCYLGKRHSDHVFF
jgi:hypothetical protein